MLFMHALCRYVTNEIVVEMVVEIVVIVEVAALSSSS